MRRPQFLLRALLTVVLTASATATATAATHPAGAQTMFAVMRNTTTGDFANINWFSFETTTPAGNGWFNVDQTAWNAQLAAFRAMTPAPVPANAVRVPEYPEIAAFPI